MSFHNVMKKHFIILTISKESYDYDILVSYLRHNSNVERVSILPQGLLIKIFYEDDDARRRLLGEIIKLDVENMTSHEILYEEFLPKKINTTNYYKAVN
jgi:hypothetical protein